MKTRSLLDDMPARLGEGYGCWHLEPGEAIPWDELEALPDYAALRAVEHKDKAHKVRLGISTLDEIEDEIRCTWNRNESHRARYAAERRESFLSGKYIPARAAAVVLGVGSEDPLFKRIEDVLAGSRNMLVLSGPVGSGKTTGAAYVSWRMEPFPLFVRAAELAAKSRYGDERTPYLKAHSLIVDDLGAEYADAKGSWLVDLDELVDRFYSSPNRLLVITTNLPPLPFSKRYGKRIADRLREAGVWISTGKESRRGTP